MIFERRPLEKFPTPPLTRRFRRAKPKPEQSRQHRSHATNLDLNLTTPSVSRIRIRYLHAHVSSKERTGHRLTAHDPDAMAPSMHVGLRSPRMTLMTAQQTIVLIKTGPGTPPLVCQLPVIPREPYRRSHSIPDLTSLTRLSAYLTPMATFTRTQASQPAASVTKLPILPNTIAIVQHKQDNICKYLQPQAVWI